MLSRTYDALEARWNRAATHRRLVDLLLASFLIGLALIEANRRGLLPPLLAGVISESHFAAIQFTFELLLVFEAIGLAFGLSYSVANATGKQFQILGLILLRQTFEQLVHFDEPITWDDVSREIGPIVYDGLGGLAIFGLLGVYYRVQRHHPVSPRQFDQSSFMRAKKGIALVVLVGFGWIVWESVSSWYNLDDPVDVFGAFYTLLIFADILLVLVSMRYTTQYRIIFRNFGFALATVLIRLALVAPPGYNALLGVGGLLYALAISALYNAYGEDRDPREAEISGRDPTARAPGADPRPPEGREKVDRTP